MERGAPGHGIVSDNDSDSGMGDIDDNTIDMLCDDTSGMSEPSNHAQRGYEDFLRQNRENKERVEELNQRMDQQINVNTCSSCNICWHEGRFRPGCEECGGFSLIRPCPICGGKCQAVWHRDTDMSHKMKSSFWNGECRLPEAERQVYYLRNVVEDSEDVLADAMNDLCGT